ncbi:hypothetical protein Esti_002217 [Eimeria stiedai]
MQAHLCASVGGPACVRRAALRTAQLLLTAGILTSRLNLVAEAFKNNGGSTHLSGGGWPLEAAGSSHLQKTLQLEASDEPLLDRASSWLQEVADTTNGNERAPPAFALAPETNHQEPANLLLQRDAPPAGAPSASVDTRVLDEGFSGVNAQQFPSSLASGLGKDSPKVSREIVHNKIAGVLTPKLFREDIRRAISEQLDAYPGTTPVIRARWHKTEQYVAAAASLRDDRGMSFCYVVLAEYASVTVHRPGNILSASTLTLLPATQESVVDAKGHRLPYPFILPTPAQLLKSAFGEEYAVAELGPESTSSLTGEAQAEEDATTEQRSDSDAQDEVHPRTPYRETHFRKAASPFLRWVPFGLTRKLSEYDATSVQATGVERERAAERPKARRENEQLFVEALSKELPQKWLEAPDGRRVVIVLNDRIAECRNLMNLALKRSEGGTPVFMEDAEGTTSRKMLFRLKDDRIDGAKIAFVVLAIGNGWQVPLSFAFFDRAVLRVPKADDIKSFLKRKEDEVEAVWTEECQELEQLQNHMIRHKQHLRELEGKPQEAPQDESELSTERQQEVVDQDQEIAAWTGTSEESKQSTLPPLLPETGASGATASAEPTALRTECLDQLHVHQPKTEEDAPVFILNPFEEYVLRFNYTEVSDVRSYAEELASELQGVPLSMTIRGEAHRVAIMILADPPETEAELGPTWGRLDRIIHVAIAVAMIIAMLCCLCMWRLMNLLKQR